MRRKRALCKWLSAFQACVSAFVQLTPARVAAYRNLRLQHVKPSTVVRELDWVQHATDNASSNWGQRLQDGNLDTQVRRPKIHNRRERRLQQGERQKLLSVVHNERTPLMKLLLKPALATGNPHCLGAVSFGMLTGLPVRS